MWSVQKYTDGGVREGIARKLDDKGNPVPRKWAEYYYKNGCLELFESPSLNSEEHTEVLRKIYEVTQD